MEVTPAPFAHCPAPEAHGDPKARPAEGPGDRGRQAPLLKPDSRAALPSRHVFVMATACVAGLILGLSLPVRHPLTATAGAVRHLFVASASRVRDTPRVRGPAEFGRSTDGGPHAVPVATSEVPRALVTRPASAGLSDPAPPAVRATRTPQPTPGSQATASADTWARLPAVVAAGMALALLSASVFALRPSPVAAMGTTGLQSPARTATAAAPAVVVGYESRQLHMPSGRDVPIAVWYPASPAAGGAGTTPAVQYAHTVSVAKVARVLVKTGSWTPKWFDLDVNLTAGAGVVPGSGAAPGVRGGVVLCHGYLGSRFDLVDYAEALARAGLVVVSPEFADGLSSPTRLPGDGGPDRGAIAAAAAALLRDGFAVERVAVVGHSAGAGTAVMTPADVRVAIAGFRQVPHACNLHLREDGTQSERPFP